MDNRPNILWICTDQQRFDTIAALGNAHIRTPHLDQLVADGMAFTHAYCQSPICTPSRASFLTGRYPSSIRACCNGNERWAEAAPLLTAELADKGYECGLVGKLHLSACHGRVEQRPAHDGYNMFEWSHHPGTEPFWPNDAHAYQAWLHDKGVDWTTAYPQSPPKEAAYPGIAAEHHQTTWCAEVAEAFIHQHRETPWLLSVNPFAPHAPFDPPPSYLARYDAHDMPAPLFRDTDLDAQNLLKGVDFQTDARPPESFNARAIKAAYYAVIEHIDDAVGRMLKALDDSNQRHNTVVIFMSDHGEMLGDHGLLLKGCRFYEGLVRVPLIISWPGHIDAGRRCEALVELTDVHATIADVVGQFSDGASSGRSLWPILSGQADPSHHRDTVRCEYYSALASRGGRFVGSRAVMHRDEQFKLCLYHGHPHGELFDLKNDPHEFTNLWQEPAHQDTRFRLLRACTDQSAALVDLGSAQNELY